MSTHKSTSSQAPSESHSVWLISANDLLQGNVVYLTTALQWSESIASALKIVDKATAQAHLTDVEENQAFVVSPIIVNALLSPNGDIVPSHFRDQFRVSGPTYHLYSHSQ